MLDCFLALAMDIFILRWEAICVNQKNNVHVSGIVMEEEALTSKESQLRVGIKDDLNLTVKIENVLWEKFKQSHPEHDGVTFSGQLQWFREGYVIKANAVTCFYNVLKDVMDDSVCQFYGKVTLQRKFDFNTNHLYLKRMVFETDNPSPVKFEGVALRGISPYFDDIQEGENLIIKANLVSDKNGRPPYWRIKSQPELLINH